MPIMRAKLRVSDVKQHTDEADAGKVLGESLKMNAVGPSGSYPADGSDDDNTYARWSPSAEFTIYVANPALFGKFAVGDKLYVDFTPEGEGRIAVHAVAGEVEQSAVSLLQGVHAWRNAERQAAFPDDLRQRIAALVGPQT